MWAITFGLLVFDAIIIYLFINQPTVLSLQETWDFRHNDLRQIEEQQQRQLNPLIPSTTPLAVEDFITHPQASGPAQILRQQLPADSQGKVL